MKKFKFKLQIAPFFKKSSRSGLIILLSGLTDVLLNSFNGLTKLFEIWNNKIITKFLNNAKFQVFEQYFVLRGVFKYFGNKIFVFISHSFTPQNIHKTDTTSTEQKGTSIKKNAFGIMRIVLGVAILYTGYVAVTTIKEAIAYFSSEKIPEEKIPEEPPTKLSLVDFDEGLSFDWFSEETLLFFSIFILLLLLFRYFFQTAFNLYVYKLLLFLLLLIVFSYLFADICASLQAIVLSILFFRLCSLTVICFGITFFVEARPIIRKYLLLSSIFFFVAYFFSWFLQFAYILVISGNFFLYLFFSNLGVSLPLLIYSLILGGIFKHNPQDFLGLVGGLVYYGLVYLGLVYLDTVLPFSDNTIIFWLLSIYTIVVTIIFWVIVIITTEVIIKKVL